jgi:hypothetical protein
MDGGGPGFLKRRTRTTGRDKFERSESRTGVKAYDVTDEN